MNLAGKTFRAVSNTAQGTISSETAMAFEIDEDGVAAGTYAGGAVVVGHVLAKWVGRDKLELLYHGATVTGEMRAGKAHGRIDPNAADGVVLHLDWQWLTGDRATGNSRWLMQGE